MCNDHATHHAVDTIRGTFWLAAALCTRRTSRWRSRLSLQGDWNTGAEAVLYESCPIYGHLSYFRRGFCAACGISPFIMLASADSGTVYAPTIVVRARRHAWKARAPYPILLIDLDEGIRMMTHGATGLRIGACVRIGWHWVGGKLLPRAETL